jgi:hypothetical protein
MSEPNGDERAGGESKGVRQGFVPETVSEASRLVPEAGPKRHERAEGESNGGEAGIRTLGTGLSPYNGLANRRFRPLSHLTAANNQV